MKPPGLDVSLFRQQLDYLRSEFSVVRTEDVLQNLRTGEPLSANATWLTFDDGFIDHYDIVFPELACRGMSAAFFPPAQPILEHVVLDVHKIHFVIASTDPEQLHLALEKLFNERDLFKIENKDFDTYFAELGTPGRFDGSLTAFAKRLLQYVLPQHVRTRLVDDLFTQFVTADENGFAQSLYLSKDQIRVMLDGGMYFGSHGFSHRWFEKESVDSQTKDISLGLEFLKDVGAPTDEWIMCYPYGSYNDDTIDILKKMNCAAGITTKSAIALVDNTSRFVLPRIDTTDLVPNQILWAANRLA